MATYKKRSYYCSTDTNRNMIVINGKTFRGNGQNISIVNGKVMIDGKNVTPDDDSKEINIHIDGYVNELSVDICDNVSVNGEAKSIKTQSGDVNIAGDVIGNVKTMSGDVKCENVSGDVSTMSGDIKKRK